jgi:hypothetical protein
MSVKWLILAVVTVAAIVACHPPQEPVPPDRMQEPKPQASPQRENPPGPVIHIIKYDLINQKVISVTEESTGLTSDIVFKVINGIPEPLKDKVIRRVDSIQILSDIASPHCTCYDYMCVGSNC